MAIWPLLSTTLVTVVSPPSPRESFVTQTNSQATLVALCCLSKQSPGNSLERKKSTAHSKTWKTNGAWNTEWGKMQNAYFLYSCKDSTRLFHFFPEVLLAESFEKTQKVPSLKSLKKLELSFLFSLCRNLTMLANIIKWQRTTWIAVSWRSLFVSYRKHGIGCHVWEWRSTALEPNHFQVIGTDESCLDIIYKSVNRKKKISERNQ